MPDSGAIEPGDFASCGDDTDLFRVDDEKTYLLTTMLEVTMR